MNSSKKFAACFVIISTCTAIAQAEIKYSVVDLGALGGVKSFGNAINNSGDVAGQSLYSSSPYFWHAFLNDGHMKDLGTLGGLDSIAHGINDSGVVVGESYAVVNSSLHAFLYDGAIHDLGTLGGRDSVALAINAIGQVVGYSTTSYGFLEAFLYDGSMHSLGTLGGTSSQAYAINNNGQVVGYSETSYGLFKSHAFLYSPDTGMVDLSLLIDPLSQWGFIRATAINDAGQIAGGFFSGGRFHAFVYDGTTHELGTLSPILPGESESEALDINSSGETVGYIIRSGDVRRAFVYTDATNMVDLNSLIDPQSGWLLSEARAINDAGQITGFGSYGSLVHAYLLTPVPEPCSVVIGAWALISIAYFRYRPPTRR